MTLFLTRISRSAHWVLPVVALVFAPLSWGVLDSDGIYDLIKTLRYNNYCGYSEIDDLAPSIDILPGETVLDVGAGDGRFTQGVLVPKAGEGNVWSLEPDEKEFIKIPESLRNKSKQENLQQFVAAQHIDFPRQFDVVTLFKYNVSVSEKQDFIKSLAQVIKPTGRVIITSVEMEKLYSTPYFEVAYMMDDLNANFRYVSHPSEPRDRSGCKKFGRVICSGPRI